MEGTVRKERKVKSHRESKEGRSLDVVSKDKLDGWGVFVGDNLWSVQARGWFVAVSLPNGHAG